MLRRKRETPKDLAVKKHKLLGGIRQKACKCEYLQPEVNSSEINSLNIFSRATSYTTISRSLSSRPKKTKVSLMLGANHSLGLFQPLCFLF
jgi:hypothetical protein